MKTKPALLVLPLLLALALVMPAAAGAVTPTVTVSGDHVELVGNDAATVRFTVSKVRDSGRAALAVTSQRLRAVIRRVQKAGGIDDADIATGRVNVSKFTERDSDGNTVGSRYRASQSVIVTVLAVKRTGAVVDAGVRAGATDVGGPNFFVADSDARYQDALLKAYDEAKEKAEALAKRSGRPLGQALSITEGGGVVYIEGSSNGGAIKDGAFEPVSAAAAPVRSGKSRVRGRVTVIFELL